MTEAENQSNDIVALATTILHTAISTTFSQMLGVGVELGTVPHGPAIDHAGRTVAGVIGWAGDWHGVGVFSCKPESACKLAELMLGTATPSLNEDSLDAVAEIANIIFGTVKCELEKVTNASALTTSTVVYGFSEVAGSVQNYSSIISIQLDRYLYYVKVRLSQNPQISPYSS